MFRRKVLHRVYAGKSHPACRKSAGFLLSQGLRKKEQERLAGKLVSFLNRKKRQKDKKEKYEKEKIA